MSKSAGRKNGGTLFGDDISIDIGGILEECYERNIATDVPGTRVDVEMIDGALFAVARYDGTYPIFRFNEADEVEYPSLEEIADSPEIAVITELRRKAPRFSHGDIRRTA